MPRTAKRKAPARRSRGARSSVSVKTVVKKIARWMKLPVEAISIVRPDRRRVQPREKLANVQAWWDSD